MRKITVSCLIGVIVFEVLCADILLGFGMPFQKWLVFGVITTANIMTILVSCGMLWSDQFAESWNKAMGERSEPKLSKQEVGFEVMKIAAHPLMIAVNIACILLIK